MHPYYMRSTATCQPPQVSPPFALAQKAQERDASLVSKDQDAVKVDECIVVQCLAEAIIYCGLYVCICTVFLSCHD